MIFSRDRRPPRRRRGVALRPGRTLLAITVVAGVVFALGVVVGLRGSPPTPPTVESRAGLDLPEGIGVSPSVAPRRPTYGYSVIPGGVWDAQQLTRAVNRDPVVAAHYSNVNLSTMRAETVTSERFAYVSYRVDDRVYWTKRKLLIRTGETILTNGQTEIRSRCGNCISLAPMLPTSEDEPDASQFDALTDEPLLVAWGWGASGLPLAVSDPAGDPDAIPVVGQSPFGPVVPFGGAVFPGEPVTSVPNDSPPGNVPAVGIPDSPPTGTSTPPGGVNPPLVGGTPLIGDSSPLDPLVLHALLSDDPAPPALPPTEPSQAIPVPEPGTLLLLGSGIAGLIVRRYHLRRASRHGGAADSTLS